MTDWNFPLTGGGAEYGINESGIETFKSGMDKSLARETIQNSLDARDDENKPVLVRFVKFNVNKKELPGYARLDDVLRKARKYYASDSGADKFYEEALRVIEGQIPCLKICDYNTLGLQGTAEQREKSTFYSLTKAQGVSNKTTNSGGAFGIGKSAPFTVSSLRTVFYSTYNIDNEFKFLGVARLTTFEDEPNQKRQNVGFYGEFNKEAQRVDELTDYSLMPEKFRRDKNSGNGTDITVAGYKISENWKTSLLNAILNDFYPAIHFNNLEVELIDEEGVLKVDSVSLPALMSEYAAGPDDSYHYFQALTEPDYNPVTELDILGKCSLYIKQGDDFPNRVQMARSPMMIVKSEGFGSPESYAALFICNDKRRGRGDELLRNLEPPAHNDWKAKLWDPLTMEPKIGNFGSQILSELRRWVKEEIDEISSIDSGKVLEIEGLGEYLPDEEVGDYEAEDEHDGLIPDKTEVRPKEKYTNTVSRPKVSIVKPVVSGGDLDSRPLKKGKRSSTGKVKNGSKEETDSDINRIVTSKIESRSREINRGAGREYILNIHPKEDTEGDLKVVAYGEVGRYDIDIECAENKHKEEMNVSGSLIKDLRLFKGVPETITIKLKDNERYSIGIENYGE